MAIITTMRNGPAKSRVGFVSDTFAGLSPGVAHIVENNPPTLVGAAAQGCSVSTRKDSIVRVPGRTVPISPSVPNQREVRFPLLNFRLDRRVCQDWT